MIRDDIKTALLDDLEVVLIVGALHADVCLASNLDTERSSHGSPFSQKARVRADWQADT